MNSAIRASLVMPVLLACATGSRARPAGTYPSDSLAIVAAQRQIRSDSIRARERAVAEAWAILQKPVPFEPTRHGLTGEATELIDRKAWYLYFNRGLTVTLEGRADLGLDEDAARALARARIDAVRRRLVERGTALGRISADESHPVPDEQSAGLVEFVVRGELTVVDIPPPGADPPPADRALIALGPYGSQRYPMASVGVFYATDRKRTAGRDPEDFYGPEESVGGALEFGRLQVSVPRVHRPGQVERPVWYRLERTTDLERHMVVQDIRPLDSTEFLDSLRRAIGRSGGKEALVFIHGYNVTFHDAALRTAQLTYDLSFDGAPILYSWPSKGSLFRYSADRESAEWSAAHLAAFLQSVVAVTGAKQVHVIAHSMGNLALVRALEKLASAPARDTLFNNLVLAAPDVPLDRFQQQLAPVIRPLARRLTVYMSGRDKALWASRLLTTHLRLGEATDPVVVVRDTDTIDASAASTDLLGHGYIASSKELIDDLVLLVAQKRPPPRGRLRPMSVAGSAYWRIP